MTHHFVGKAYALIQVPNQRLFGPAAAARYLGISTDTLYKISDLGEVTAYNWNGRRAYRLEDLDRLIESLPKWDDAAGEKPASIMEERIS